MLTLHTGDDVIHARNYNVISFTPSILLVDVWRDSIVCPPLFARRNVRPSDALHIRHPLCPTTYQQSHAHLCDGRVDMTAEAYVLPFAAQPI